MITEGLIAAIAGGIGAIITGLGALVVNIIKAKKTKTGDRELEYSHMEKMVSLMSGVSQNFQDFKKDINKRFDEVSLGFDGISTQLSQFHQEQTEYNITMIRHDIVQVYETYRGVKRIPEQVYQSTFELYDIYKGLGGNSYVRELVEEMKKWERG